MKREGVTCTIFTGVLCCLLPFFFAGNKGLFGYQICIAACAVFTSCILPGVLCLKKETVLSVSWNDVFVFLYLIYGSFHLYLFRDDLPLHLFARWAILITVYILTRNTNNSYLPLFLWGSCTLQAIIGLGQFAGIVEGNHSLFCVTGCFWNPSQLGGFIACFFPLIVIELITRKYSAWCWLSLLPMACVLALSDSRAAWLACGIGVLYVLPVEFKGKLKIGLVSLGLVVIGMGLYFYRPLSALGRLNVWLVCKNMIQENPLWGSGIHSFASEYMLYQADYLNQYPGSDFAEMASLVTTPYNEFIHVLVEQGGVGFLLFLLLLGSYFFFTRGGDNKKYQGVILAFVLFSCFSYPGENVTLLFGLVACMGAVRGGECFQFQLSRFRKRVIAVVLVVCVCVNVKIMKEYHSLTLVAKQLLEPSCISRYRNEPEALQYLLHEKSSLSLSDRLKMQEWISEKLPAPETYCELGVSCEQLHEYGKAEKYYQIAADMIPNQIRANYFLFKLYEKTGRVAEAYNVATVISRQNIKIENTFTLSVQGEIERYLKKTR